MDFLEVIWLFVVDISVVFDQYWESNTQRSNSHQAVLEVKQQLSFLCSREESYELSQYAWLNRRPELCRRKSSDAMSKPRGISEGPEADTPHS